MFTELQKFSIRLSRPWKLYEVRKLEIVYTENVNFIIILIRNAVNFCTQLFLFLRVPGIFEHTKSQIIKSLNFLKNFTKK